MSARPDPAVARPQVLAHGPWELDAITVRWQAREYEPSPAASAAADTAMRSLRDRGSPSHDGLAGRLVACQAMEDRLELELQPARWSLRLLPGDAHQCMAASCLIRDHAGRWLAARRAPWVASWPGRWALGAGGAVDVGENPADTLIRELHEEWSVVPERAQVDVLLLTEHKLAMLVGTAWLAVDAEVSMDAEHDAYEWWPPEVADWPSDAHPALRHMTSLVSEG